MGVKIKNHNTKCTLTHNRPPLDFLAHKLPSLDIPSHPLTQVDPEHLLSSAPPNLNPSSLQHRQNHWEVLSSIFCQCFSLFFVFRRIRQCTWPHEDNGVDAPFFPGYLFRFNFCWTFGPFVSRFEFGRRTYSVSLFILFVESLIYCFKYLFVFYFS